MEQNADPEGMKNNIYIHMGYGRTGTTWLQDKVFPAISGLRYLGKREGDYPDWLINWNYLDRLVLPRETDWIRDHINKAREVANVLISSEAFTQTGGIVDQIERIKAVAECPKIILVIRDPVDLVVSKYRRLFKVGFLKEPIEHYLDYSPRPFDLVRRKRLYLHDYVFPLVIERLFQEFNPQNTLVLKYELLVKEPRAFVGVILKFLEADEPMGLDYSSVNRSDESIFVDPQVVKELRSFFGSIFNYGGVPDSQCML
jgi:hypothetical protein